MDSHAHAGSTPGAAEGAGAGSTPGTQPPTMAEVQEKIDQMYGSRHASNLGDGLLKGAVSVGKGIFAGVGGLIAAPLVGASREGGKGFLKGAAVGLAGVVVLPTIGVVHGVRQVGSGIKNTPEAVKRMMEKDKNEEAAEKADVVDDPKSEEVNEKTYSLTREQVEGFAFDAAPQAPKAAAGEGDAAPATGTAAAAGSGVVYLGTETPKESDFYEVLGVQTTASYGEIKKSYYKLAVRLHPDKNPGDEGANARFAEVGEAYQVLIDPERREVYDRLGKEGLAGGATMDPREFFNMAFGAEAFKPLIGELTLARAAGQDMTPESFRVWQAEREKALAEGLLERLRPWLDGKEEAFVWDTLRLVESLKEEDFAVPMLQCIGYTYYHKAEVCLGLQSLLGVPGYLHGIRQHGHNLKSQYKAVDAAVRIQDIQQRAAAGDAPEGTFSEFLNALWLISALDIESTLRHVVDLVVLDKNIPKDERKARARGIMRLGKILLDT